MIRAIKKYRVNNGGPTIDIMSREALLKEKPIICEEQKNILAEEMHLNGI